MKQVIEDLIVIETSDAIDATSWQLELSQKGDGRHAKRHPFQR
jgi:hypothetical protein